MLKVLQCMLILNMNQGFITLLSPFVCQNRKQKWTKLTCLIMVWWYPSSNKVKFWWGFWIWWVTLFKGCSALEFCFERFFWKLLRSVNGFRFGSVVMAWIWCGTFKTRCFFFRFLCLAFLDTFVFCRPEIKVIKASRQTMSVMIMSAQGRIHCTLCI